MRDLQHPIHRAIDAQDQAEAAARAEKLAKEKRDAEQREHAANKWPVVEAILKEVIGETNDALEARGRPERFTYNGIPQPEGASRAISYGYYSRATVSRSWSCWCGRQQCDQ
ncbi:MAG TPA: hypothetical protein VGA65_05925 [Hyphomicrobium sp.]